MAAHASGYGSYYLLMQLENADVRFKVHNDFTVAVVPLSQVLNIYKV